MQRRRTTPSVHVTSNRAHGWFDGRLAAVILFHPRLAFLTALGIGLGGGVLVGVLFR